MESALRQRLIVSALCMVIGLVQAPSASGVTCAQNSSAHLNFWQRIVRFFSGSPNGNAAGYLTTYKNRDHITPLAPVGEMKFKYAKSASDGAVIDIDPDVQFNGVDGYGANLTETSVLNIQKLSPEKRRRLMEELFSPQKGAGLNYIRVPLGASDFVDREKGFYTYDDSPGDKPDPDFAHFSMERDRKTIEFLKDAKALNPDLVLMLSPWSAPTWMKKGGKKFLQGTLDEKRYDDFARYFVKTIEAYEREGLPVKSVTVVNEPYFDDNVWYISMPMTTESQIAFIAKGLGPEFKRRGLKTEILALDHNYEDAEKGIQIMTDPRSREFLSGMSFHCYGGTAESTKVVTEKIPGTKMIQTECTGLVDGHQYKKDVGQWLSAQILQPTMSGSIAWNLALLSPDKRPPSQNPCAECVGFVTIDPDTGDYKFEQEFYATQQGSRYIRRGARPVLTSLLNAKDGVTQMVTMNPDGSYVAIVDNHADSNQRVYIREPSCEAVEYDLPSKSSVTFTWKPKHLKRPTTQE
jgi:glucosylceramidase